MTYIQRKRQDVRISYIPSEVLKTDNLKFIINFIIKYNLINQL